jgi:quercetin dioxygenase-like cupin family protein
MTEIRVEQFDAGYLLPKDGGVIDLWWPYQPRVGRYTIKLAAEQNGGRLSHLLGRDARGGGPPLHVHRREDESFYVIAGEMTFVVGDQRFEAVAGDFVFAPQGVPHAYVVTSESAEYMTSFFPAGIEAFFAAVAPPVVPGEPAPAPREVGPDVVRTAADYGVEVLGPPPVVR